MRQLPTVVRIATAAAVVIAAPTAGQVSERQGPPRGAHSVGYRVLYETDASRAWPGADSVPSDPELGRPIRASVWYPAVSGSGASMARRDYLYYDAPTSAFALLNELWLLWDPQRQCLHDKVARTVVIKVDAAPPRQPNMS